MAKNIEKQGLRKGYIVGGIFALLLAAVLIMLYLPTFLQDAFNIGLIWDLSGTFTNLLGDNFMSLVNEWGTIAVLALLFLIYFICLCARPSTGSTFFRLCCMFACIGVALPFLVTQLNSILGEFDISQYINYGILGVFVLCFIFWLIAIVCLYQAAPKSPSRQEVFGALYRFRLYEPSLVFITPPARRSASRRFHNPVRGRSNQRALHTRCRVPQGRRAGCRPLCGG